MFVVGGSLLITIADPSPLHAITFVFFEYGLFLRIHSKREKISQLAMLAKMHQRFASGKAPLWINLEHIEYGDYELGGGGRQYMMLENALYPHMDRTMPTVGVRIIRLEA